MSADAAANVLREALVVGAAVGAPVLGALLVSGLGVGVLQATTQVNDPAVGFLPRLLVAVGVLAATGPSALERLAALVVRAFEAGAQP